MKKYYIKTFGCSMNQADSEKINMILLQSGFIKVDSWKKANLVIFNTCSVRKKGEDRVFGMTEEIYKENIKKKANIVVGITGCMVRKTGMNQKYTGDNKERKTAKKIEILKNKQGIFNSDDKLFPRLGEKLNFTLRIEETKLLPFILGEIYGEKLGQDDKFDDYLKQIQLRENKSSANIIVQTGCDNYCTFCIVPYTRGKEISRPTSEIVEECREAVNSGAKEINLIGQNVNSYGKQFLDKKLWNEEKGKWNSGVGKSPFKNLLEEIDKIQGLDRIRFTSSNPHDMTQDIIDSHFELNHTCNYLHFALQSGNNKMLKKMNRKHTYEDFRDMVIYLRKKDPLFSISTDIIVGFSGETDDMFEDTIKAFKECEFDFAYNARYSVRPGTIAARMYPDDIPDKIKAERWHILNNLLLESVKKRNEMMIGREEDILISGEKDNYFFGRTRNFKEVFIEKNDNLKIYDYGSVGKQGNIVKVKITDLDKWVLKGKLV